MSPYAFVVAAVLAVLPILILFKIMIERIKENPENIGKIQVQFFIGVALSEILPLILIVYGFANIETVASAEEIYLPIIITLLMVGFANFFIFLQRLVDVEEDMKNAIFTFSAISMALTSSIPIVSILALFTMMP